MVVASASPKSYYYNSRFPQYQQQPRYQQQPQYGYPAPQQAVYQPVAPVAAPLVKAAPVALPVASDFGLGSLSSLASMDFSSLSSLMALLPQAGTSLAKASKSLDDLTLGLPAVLANMSPETKADVGKINVIIAEVCNRIEAEATPSGFSYYSKGGIKSTCDFINKISNDILLSLDDPSIVQSYVDKVQKLTRSLQAQASIYSNLFE